MRSSIALVCLFCLHTSAVAGQAQVVDDFSEGGWTRFTSTPGKVAMDKGKLYLEDGRDPPAWVNSCAQRGGVGLVAFAPGGTPHTFRVESDTAKMLFLSTPAGIEDYVRALAKPARWPWLQPPQDGPRVAVDKMQAVEGDLGMIRHGPPPPATPPTR